MDTANYCSLRITGIAWTGLCLPSSCTIDNVEDSFRVSSAQIIAQIGTSNLLSLQAIQNETITELDMYLIEKGVPAASIPGLNIGIQGASIGLIGATAEQLQESVTIWISASSPAVKWECGGQGKWPPVVAAFLIPLFILIAVVSCSTLLDSQWTYERHQQNKRHIVNSEGGYSRFENTGPIHSEENKEGNDEGEPSLIDVNAPEN